MGPYQTKYEQVLAAFKKELADGNVNPSLVALNRRVLAKMKDHLENAPKMLPVYGIPDQWHSKVRKEVYDADEKLGEARAKKMVEFRNVYAVNLINNINAGNDHVVKDKYNGIAYLVTYDNQRLKKVVMAILTEMAVWLDSHEPETMFYQQSMNSLCDDFLKERQDLVAVLKLTNELAMNVEKSEIQVDRPMHVEVCEFAIGLIPFVGSAVALYESYNGHDIFGYKLTTTERTILAATAVLPTLGRFVKGGKALYTASRMQRLYGRDAKYWSRMIGAGESLSKDIPASKLIRESEVFVRQGKSLDAAISKQIEQALKRTSFAVKTAAPVETIISAEVKKAFQNISSKFSIIANLDELAIQRLVNMGGGVDRVKGQLLEELLEDMMNKWLREASADGIRALGLKTAGKQLQFFPGHLIRDTAGRQVTDGILGTMVGNKLEILAVFEAKAGKSAARELSAASTSISKLTKDELKELKHYARDVIEELAEEARLAGKPFTKTADDVMKEIILTERGGQITRDMERMQGSKLRIGGELIDIIISSSKTKFFGVVPQGFSTSAIEKELKNLKYNFEILGIAIPVKDIEAIAAEILKITP
jgi:hypothetical protein